MPTTPFLPKDTNDLLTVRRGIIAMGEAAGAIERIFENPDHPIARLLNAAATLALEQVEAEATPDQNETISWWLDAFSPEPAGWKVEIFALQLHEPTPTWRTHSTHILPASRRASHVFGWVDEQVKLARASDPHTKFETRIFPPDRGPPPEDAPEDAPEE